MPHTGHTQSPGDLDHLRGLFRVGLRPSLSNQAPPEVAVAAAAGQGPHWAALGEGWTKGVVKLTKARAVVPLGWELPTTDSHHAQPGFCTQGCLSSKREGKKAGRPRAFGRRSSLTSMTTAWQSNG